MKFIRQLANCQKSSARVADILYSKHLLVRQISVSREVGQSPMATTNCPQNIATVCHTIRNICANVTLNFQHQTRFGPHQNEIP